MTAGERPRCGAKLKTRPGERCTNPPMTDQTRCRMHGGAAPKAKAAAARRRQTAELERALVTYGLPVEVDPVDALLGELARTHGAVLWLEQQVRALDADALTWSKTEEVEKHATEFGGTDTTHAAAVPVVVQLYSAERDRLVRVAEACRKAGVEQAVQERTKALAADFLAQLERVVRALGHDTNDPAVLRIVSSVLRGAPIPPAIEGQAA